MLMNRLKKALVGVVVISCMCASAPAFEYYYYADLSGAAESPPNASPGTGFAWVTWDDVAHTLRLQASFSGLIGLTTAAHIHAATAAPLTGTAGVATTVPTFPGFPLGVTAGTYDQTFDLTLLSSYNPAFVTANGGTAASAEAALFAAIDSDRSYLNVHSTAYGGGEIRGFLTRVPDGGSTLGLLSVGFLAAGALRQRFQR